MISGQTLNLYKIQHYLQLWNVEQQKQLNTRLMHYQPYNH